MRILAVSNLYPPHHIGGYELGCRDVVEGLRARGHEVEVLTSTHGVDGPRVEGHVRRLLRPRFPHLPHDIHSDGALLAHERECQARLRERIRAFRPDVVHFWGMTGLPISLAFLAQRLGLPTAFYVSDDWPRHWRERDAWHYKWSARGEGGGRRAPQRAAIGLLAAAGLMPFSRPLGFGARAAFTSGALLREVAEGGGVNVEGAAVIRWGVDCGRFRPRDVPDSPGGGGARMLFVGQVMPHKGVHTAVEALRWLEDVRLTVVGRGTDPAYEAGLRSSAEGWGVADRVEFRGAVPREELPDLYRAHDLFVFPSVWSEPFSITLLEAMASGLAAVATDTGGSGEILRHGENALTFPKEDARALAAHAALLFASPQQRTALAREARRTVAEGFSLDRMLDRIEAHLCAAVAATGGRPSGGSDTGAGPGHDATAAVPAGAGTAG